MSELRRRVVRGTVVNAVALSAIDALVLVQGLIVTRLLGPAAIGLYGIVTTTAMTIVALRRTGLDEAFVNRTGSGDGDGDGDGDGEEAVEFQRAFTLELVVGTAFAGLLLALAPLVAAAYGDDRLLGLMAATAYLPVAIALQAPGWIFFRRMDFVRQRALQAVVPLVTFAVTVPLAAAGAGVWSLVIGPAAGNVAGAIAAVAVSPHPLRLRWDGAAARRYLRFGGGVLVATGAFLLIQQGQVLAFTLEDGLAAAGFLTLAVTFTRYLDRADMVVAAAIYPAIVRLQGRPAALADLFVRSNRATLLYTLPAAAALVLFAEPLVDTVLGDAWAPAVVLLQGLAVATALQQLAFNWFSFYRARGETRPGAVEALTSLTGFAVFAVPGLLVAGFEGFVAGRCLGVLGALGVRVAYVRRLLPAVSIRALLARPVVPAVAGVVAVLLVRALGLPVPVELVVFAAVVGGVTLVRERALLAELADALRGGGRVLGAGEDEPGEHDRDAGQGGQLPVPVQAAVGGPGDEGRGRAGPAGAGA